MLAACEPAWWRAVRPARTQRLCAPHLRRTRAGIGIRAPGPDTPSGNARRRGGRSQRLHAPRDRGASAASRVHRPRRAYRAHIRPHTARCTHDRVSSPPTAAPRLCTALKEARILSRASCATDPSCCEAASTPAPSYRSRCSRPSVRAPAHSWQRCRGGRRCCSATERPSIRCMLRCSARGETIRAVRKQARSGPRALP